jgi:hypothetical protein
MAPQVGTYAIADLLDVRFQSVNEFGSDTVVETLQADLAAHNAIVNEMVSDLAVLTTDTQGVYGSGAVGQMMEVDEFGRSETQKVAPGSTVAFPLRLFQYATGWTRKYLQQATPRDLALHQLAAEESHRKKIRYEIKRAIFNSTNYTFTDFLINNVALGVKRFVNADSAAIPDAPDGSTFTASTHTHYDGSATLTTTAVDAAITDLIEHGHGGKVMLAIHYSNAAAFAALTGFVAALPSYVQVPAYNVTTPGVRTDLGNQYNRLLGYYGAAEVWVKPWAIANYMFLWDGGSPLKPLAFRQRAGGNVTNGLQIAAELEAYPLYAKYYEAEFGIGVLTRTNGVVVKFDNATYSNPTITE